MIRVTVTYYASLREARGCSEEQLETAASTPAELLSELDLPLAQAHLRASVNHAFVGWDHRLQAGDVVSFVPPVAGG